MKIGAQKAEELPSPEAAEWGSDAIADFLRNTGIPFITLNPGASFRGLHDSLVNHLDAKGPDMIMCLHEEHAVALAHGYAKVTGLPLAVALHSNVGLMHASMAIFNAYCDRVPMLIIGANGPLDAAKRRPWIDWIHTSADQPAIVRNYIKWDDTPTSVNASLESLARAWDIARTAPQGPTYVVLDTEVQETPLLENPLQPKITVGLAKDQPVASAESVARAATLLISAKNPVLLMGRGSKNLEDFQRRIRLAEELNARVITDLKAGSSFPTKHPAHVPGSGFFLGERGQEALRSADVVLALDWIDVAGTLRQAHTGESRKVISAGLDQMIINGWSKDHQARAEVDVWLPTTGDYAVSQLLDALKVDTGRAAALTSYSSDQDVQDGGSIPKAGPIQLDQLAHALRSSLAKEKTTLVRLPLGWNGDDWPFGDPLDFLGYDGGGGIGSGPGMTVGAALALKGSDRIAVSVLGDGDYMMGVQALWTAAHDDIPFLAVVANNRSYFNDEVHQERVALARDRDVTRKWIGQRIDEPAPDLAAMARAQGLEGLGPIRDLADLPDALDEALKTVKSGRGVVVDVVVSPGYNSDMKAGLVREP